MEVTCKLHLHKYILMLVQIAKNTIKHNPHFIQYMMWLKTSDVNMPESVLNNSNE